MCTFTKKITKYMYNLYNMLYILFLFVCFSIGYPVVTLGFGFKSYVGFRMRLRRQKEVEKENDYYYEFLREALPPGVREEVSHLVVVCLHLFFSYIFGLYSAYFLNNKK